MKTYTETEGESPFDWNVFLKKESITEDEWNEASDLASNWITCACGNQCAVIERDEEGTPKDELLMNLGLSFTTTIYFQRDQSKALRILDQIETRSAQLIADHHAANPKK
ncbi:MAG: hypothetical protein WBG71_04330 [Leeuwenhoekiella sp.]